MTLYLEEFKISLGSRKRWLFIVGLLVLGLSFALVQQPPSEVRKLFYPVAGLASFEWVADAHDFVIIYVMTLFFGYAIGAGIWALFVTTHYVRLLADRFVVVVKPGHPDGAGGLMSIGSFSLLLVTPVLTGIALAAFYGIRVIGRWVGSQSQFVFLVSDLIVLCVVLVPLASAVFFRTLWRFHHLLVQQKRVQHDSFAIMEANCRTHLDKAVVGGDSEDIQRSAEALKSVHELESHWTKFSAWPFDGKILAKFATPQIISVGGFLFPLVKKLTEH